MKDINKLIVLFENAEAKIDAKNKLQDELHDAEGEVKSSISLITEFFGSNSTFDFRCVYGFDSNKFEAARELVFALRDSQKEPGVEADD